MYQVITEIRVNGKREADSVYSKIYVRKGAAERNARSNLIVVQKDDGTTIELKAYVRGLLKPVDEAEAMKAYCRCKRVWIDGEYGQKRIANSWEYGSYAPIEELFYRSVCQCGGYGYNGNYYVEYEKGDE